METVIIFTGCHLSQRHVIENCTPFEIANLKKMAMRNNWPFTLRRKKQTINQ